jgi:hypothetical protein
MPLETASYIHQLDAANPLGSDPIASGDDHLRLVKATVKATFPNITGPVTVTQDDINSKVPNAAQQSDLTTLTNSFNSAVSTINTALDTKAAKTITVSPGTGLTGGGDLTANRTIALANTSVTPGSYGSATKLARVTVDAQGRITEAQEFNLPAPSVLAQGSYSTNTTYSVGVSGSNRPVQISMHHYGVQGSTPTISVQFQWGIGGLSESFYSVPSWGPNYVVDPSASILVFVTPTNNNTIQFRVNSQNLSNESFFVSIIQL